MELAPFPSSEFSRQETRQARLSCGPVTTGPRARRPAAWFFAFSNTPYLRSPGGGRSSASRPEHCGRQRSAFCGKLQSARQMAMLSARSFSARVYPGARCRLARSKELRQTSRTQEKGARTTPRSSSPLLVARIVVLPSKPCALKDSSSKCFSPGTRSSARATWAAWTQRNRKGVLVARACWGG